MGQSSGLTDDEVLRRARSRGSALGEQADISSEVTFGDRTASSNENENLASGQGSGSDSLPLQPTRLLGSRALQRSMNAQRRADLFLDLQQTRGNNYTRRLARSFSGDRSKAQTSTASAQRTPTPVQRDDKGKSKPRKPYIELHIKAAKQGALTLTAQAFEGRVSNDAANEKGHNEANDTELRIVMAFGQGSAELFKALQTNELLKEIRVDFKIFNEKTDEAVTQQSITWHNLYVASISVTAPKDRLRGGQDLHDVDDVESVTFRSKGASSSKK